MDRVAFCPVPWLNWASTAVERHLQWHLAAGPGQSAGKQYLGSLARRPLGFFGSSRPASARIKWDSKWAPTGERSRAEDFHIIFQNNKWSLVRFILIWLYSGRRERWFSDSEPSLGRSLQPESSNLCETCTALNRTLNEYELYPATTTSPDNHRSDRQWVTSGGFLPDSEFAFQAFTSKRLLSNSAFV